MTLTDLLHTLRPDLVSFLHRSFQGACPGLIDDAIGSTCLQVLEHPERFDPERHGLVEAGRKIRVVAWRALAGQHRRAARRWERGSENVEGEDLETPERFLVARWLDDEVDALVGEAARAYGGRRPERLEAALRERLEDDVTDGEVALRHGLPRETLNRARSWLRARVRELVQQAA